jgi:hypothetical protein
MRRLPAGALIALVLIGAAAGAASAANYRIQIGDAVFVGVPLACAVEQAKSAPAVVCLERNPKNGRVYRPSLGVVMIAGKTGSVAIQAYDKTGKVSNIWVRRQSNLGGTSRFPTGKGGHTSIAHGGDRYAVGGTNILCPVSSPPAILCAAVSTKTLKPIPGTYGIYANGKSVEVFRVTKGGGFKSVTAYNQPPFKA